MRLVIQRVSHASVTIDNKVNGKIGKGFLVLIGMVTTQSSKTSISSSTTNARKRTC